MSVRGRLIKVERETKQRIGADIKQAAGGLSRKQWEGTIACYQLTGDEHYRDWFGADRLLELTAAPDAAKTLVSLLHSGLLQGCLAMRPETRRAVGWPPPERFQELLEAEFDADVSLVLEAVAELAADLADKAAELAGDPALTVAEVQA